MRRPELTLRQTRALSLVEVVLALGIVSIVILAIVGLFGSLLGQRGDTASRRETVSAAETLPVFLNAETPYETVYGWLAGGAKTLIFATFRANRDGQPNPSGDRLVSRWMEEGNLPPGLEQALDGRVVKATVEIDGNLNPSGPALPAVGLAPDSYVALRASLVPLPQINAADSDSTPLVLPIVVSR